MILSWSAFSSGRCHIRTLKRQRCFGVTRDKVREGDHTHFIRSTEHPICHVRPKAKNAADTIFREALKAGAEEIIVAHNHPSGDLTPSKADIAATTKLREAADLMGVPLIDHLILGTLDCAGNTNFVSLVELSLI